MVDKLCAGDKDKFFVTFSAYNRAHGERCTAGDCGKLEVRAAATAEVLINGLMQRRYANSQSFPNGLLGHC